MFRKFCKTTISKNAFVDNFVFRLNYRWTVILLVSCSFIITCKLFLGNSFSCSNLRTNSNNSVLLGSNQTFLETKCYADGVYITPSYINKSHHDHFAKPTTTKHADHGHLRYQHYYSWVNLLLLFHAFCFYLPHLIWSSYESGSISRLTADLETSDKNHRSSKLSQLAKYILISDGNHRLFTWVHICCEAFNYIVCLSLTLCLVYFFKVTGVPESFPFNIKTWSDFQTFYFPSFGVCAFTMAKVRYQSVCLLPLNTLHMVMFLFIHAWYICLSIATATVLVYRILLLSSSIRFRVLKLKSPLTDMETLKTLCHMVSYSDWFYLTKFQRVLTETDFKELLVKILTVPLTNDEDKKDVEKLSLYSVEDKKESENLVGETHV